MWQLYIETFVDLLGNSSEQQIKRVGFKATSIIT